MLTRIFKGGVVALAVLFCMILDNLVGLLGLIGFIWMMYWLFS